MSSRLTVHVKPGSKISGFERIGESYVLRVRERAIDGAANAACVRALAEYVDVPRSQVRLVSGERARLKTFEFTGLSSEELQNRLLRAEGTIAPRAKANNQ